MMALAEFARAEGVFDWIATRAVHAARGSRSRLLLLVYGAGVVTTAFLSNDATIVVLTPAVLDAVARTDARPHAYVFACALVANAASFVLPIANPSNLLFFADRMPPLRPWLASFALASVASVVLTYAALALLFRRDVAAPLVVHDGRAPTPRALAFVVLAISAVVLVVTSSLDGPLGHVTFACGAAAALLCGDARAARAAADRARHRVAGRCADGGAVRARRGARRGRRGVACRARCSRGPRTKPRRSRKLGVALAAALASNLVNNLPVGLDLGKYVGAAHPPAALSAAALVGVNVGPNFTANGSLATLLWLAILRREGVRIGAAAVRARRLRRNAARADRGGAARALAPRRRCSRRAASPRCRAAPRP